jgi:hypothetical protein
MYKNGKMRYVDYCRNRGMGGIGTMMEGVNSTMI